MQNKIPHIVSARVEEYLKWTNLGDPRSIGYFSKSFFIKINMRNHKNIDTAFGYVNSERGENFSAAL